MMPVNLFYGPMRVVLGDRQVHGLWNYTDDTLGQAVNTVFFLNRQPAGYVIVPDDSGDIQKAAIDPSPIGTGDMAAWITYEAALLTIGGEEGAYSMRTKVVSVHDFGERKRDLLAELRIQIYRIKDGDAVFTSMQSFIAFLGNMPASGKNNVLGPIAEFSSVNLRTGIQDLAI